MGFFNICTVRPDNFVYARAFDELSELLFHSIRQLGHECTRGYNKISREANCRNIVIGVHLLGRHLIGQIPKETIILNTEQVSGTFSDWRERLGAWFEAGFEIWDYSLGNINVINRHASDKAKLLKIGYQPELNRIESGGDEDVDVLFYGNLNPRRTAVLDDLQKQGVNIKVLQAVYGAERDAWIGRSKIVLNHHFYDSQIFEVVRVFYLLTNARVVVGEVNKGTIIDKRFLKGIVPASYGEIVPTIIDLLADREKLERQKQIALESIRKYPQERFTRKILQDRARGRHA